MSEGQLALLVRRYGGAVGFFAVLALIIALVPSVSPTSVREIVPGDEGAIEEELAGSDRRNSSSSPASTGKGTPVTGPVNGGPTTVVAPKPGTPGTTRTGVACGPSVRQFPWSSYAPTCVPAFKGSNGGATSRGVTATSITLTYRTSNSGQSAAVNAATGGGDPNGVQEKYFEDLRTFTAYFNTQFELYGRKIQLKKFAGRGDWVAEYQDQNQEAAQADAVTARDLGAFADVSSFLVATTPPYARALADQKVISIGGVASSRQALKRDAPFVYTGARTADDVGTFNASLICQRMVGLPAIFAGDETMKRTTRKFGLIHPDNPDYSPAGDIVASRVKSCGGVIARRVRYTLDIPSMASQSANIMAQMKDAGATTVVCICDNVVMTFLSRSATQQLYRPEWLPMWNGDSDQLRDQDQWAHAVSGAYGASIDPKTAEAYKVYKRINPKGEPAHIQSINTSYMVSMLVFGALQAAGPNLTPDNFEKGFFSLPPSKPGAYLPWKFGSGQHSPITGFRITWWDPRSRSPSNGRDGVWRNCAGSDGGFHTTRTFDPVAFGPKRTQLHCFGG